MIAFLASSGACIQSEASELELVVRVNRAKPGPFDLFAFEANNPNQSNPNSSRISLKIQSQLGLFGAAIVRKSRLSEPKRGGKEGESLRANNARYFCSSSFLIQLANVDYVWLQIALIGSERNHWQGQNPPKRSKCNFLQKSIHYLGFPGGPPPEY